MWLSARGFGTTKCVVQCGCVEDKVIDSRSSKEGAIIRRRRECDECQHRFTTYEQIEHQRLMVVKRDGRREISGKSFSGISKAAKRPISQQVIDLTQRIYDTISNTLRKSLVL